MVAKHSVVLANVHVGSKLFSVNATAVLPLRQQKEAPH